MYATFTHFCQFYIVLITEFLCYIYYVYLDASSYEHSLLAFTKLPTCISSSTHLVFFELKGITNKIIYEYAFWIVFQPEFFEICHLWV